MQSKAITVAAYIKELPPERRRIIICLRKLIKQSLPTGFKEGMQYGMIGYFVPHRLYPAGYHCNPKEPLPYICLASQKNHCSLYLYAQYSSSDENKWFQQAWKATGKKMNMGKSCVRFKNTEELPLNVIAEAVERLSVEQYIDIYESVTQNQASVSAKTKEKNVSIACKDDRTSAEEDGISYEPRRGNTGKKEVRSETKQQIQLTAQGRKEHCPRISQWHSAEAASGAHMLCQWQCGLDACARLARCVARMAQPHPPAYRH